MNLGQLQFSEQLRCSHFHTGTCIPSLSSPPSENAAPLPTKRERCPPPHQARTLPPSLPQALGSPPLAQTPSSHTLSHITHRIFPSSPHIPGHFLPLTSHPSPHSTFTLTLAFAPLTVFKFNLYAAMTRDNPWSSMMGSSDPSDEEQDTVKVGGGRAVRVLHQCGGRGGRRLHVAPVHIA